MCSVARLSALPLIEPAQSDSDDVRTASIVWRDAPEGVQGWYAKVTSPYGGSATSAVDYVTVGVGTGEQQPSDGQQPSGGQQSSSSGRPDGEKPADTGAGVMVPTVIAAVALLIAGSCMALRSRGAAIASDLGRPSSEEDGRLIVQ